MGAGRPARVVRSRSGAGRVASAPPPPRPGWVGFGLVFEHWGSERESVVTMSEVRRGEGERERDRDRDRGSAGGASGDWGSDAGVDPGIESIVVKTRWFGIAAGFLLVETSTGARDPVALRAFLALGAAYALLDTHAHRRGRVFLGRWPLFVSLMEAVFIGLLCYHDTGMESRFRFYYLLSLICCAFRHPAGVAWATFGFDCASLGALGLVSAVRNPVSGVSGVAEAWDWGDVRGGMTWMVLVLAWVTWTSCSLAGLLKGAGRRLRGLNRALEANRADLERRVAERSAALRASQARVIHQEKMAAFGLLAAGIAHEVGNPLTAISSLIQMLQRRGPDAYTGEKLDLASRELGRIQRTIRELVDFSRPGPSSETWVRPRDAVEDALSIAKYYHRTKDRRIATDFAEDLPRARAVRDRLAQVVLNLLMNAIDATEKGGSIRIAGEREDSGGLRIRVEDDGRGVSEGDLGRLFEPYFTTKPSGTGLGLFVSRQIMEELGGSLDCESVPGRGASFTLRVPASRVEGSVSGAVSEAVSEAGAVSGAEAVSVSGSGRLSSD